MSKFVIVGDLHGDKKSMESIIEIERPQFVLQTGDQLDYNSQLCPIYYITGDDENADVLENYVIPNEEYMNMYCMMNGVRERLDGVTIGGLSGLSFDTLCDFDVESYEIFEEDDIKICKSSLIDVDIFLSHESPSGIVDKFGSDLVRDLISVIQPRFSFSSHLHTYNRIKWGRTTMVMLPLAQCGYYVLDFDGHGQLHSESYMQKKESDTGEIEFEVI